MLTLKQKLTDAKTDHNKNIIQYLIDSTDQQIDQLVYEFYGLTDGEIIIVEKSIANK